jgi:hypothetical protein
VTDRETIVPLMFGLVASLLSHAVAIPLLNRSMHPTSVPLLEPLTPRPDLAVVSVSAPTVLRADESFALAFEVVNRGEQATENAWRDVVAISRDEHLDDEDVLFGEQAVAGPLGRGERATRAFESLAVPADYRGPVYIIAQTDRGDAVDEGGREANNVRAVLVRIVEPPQPVPEQTPQAMGPKPDLIVQAVDAPEQMIAGEPFEMKYEVANVGEVPAAPGDWLNSVYISKDDQLDSDDMVLHSRPQRGDIAPGTAQPMAVGEAAIDERFAGDAFLIIEADSDNRIDEQREDNNAVAVPIKVIVPQRVDDDEIRLGGDEAKPAQVAWIPYESYQELLAPKSETEQPPVQDQVDPAPVERSTPQPTPAVASVMVPAAPQPPRPQPPTEPMEGEAETEQEQADAMRRDPAQPAAQEASEPLDPQVAQAQTSPPVPLVEPMGLPRVINRDDAVPGPSSMEAPEQIQPQEDDEQPGEVASDISPTEPAEQRAMDQPQPQRDEQVEQMDQQPAETAVPEPDGEPTEQQRQRPTMPAATVAATAGRPTPVPRSDAEADAVSLTIDSRKIRPGQVITGEGIVIRTARPHISAVARASIMPMRYPVAVVRFDRTGKVTKAVLTTNTGQDSWDAPIVASLYEWRASGRKLEELDGPFEIEIELLLGR